MNAAIIDSRMRSCDSVYKLAVKYNPLLWFLNKRLKTPMVSWVLIVSTICKYRGIDWSVHTLLCKCGFSSNNY